jgi:hypothetical protein
VNVVIEYQKVSDSSRSGRQATLCTKGLRPARNDSYSTPYHSLLTKPRHINFFSLRRCRIPPVSQIELLTVDGLGRVLRGICTSMQIDARHEEHEAVVGGRRPAKRAMLTTRKRTVSVPNATSLDEFDRYQAKDTIWTISVQIMMTVCQEDGRGELRRIQHGIVTMNWRELGRQPTLDNRNHYVLKQITCVHSMPWKVLLQYIYIEWSRVREIFLTSRVSSYTPHIRAQP